MSRRQKVSDPTMFPFLNVLCCVIAVMVLFIVLTLSTRVVESEEEGGGGGGATEFGVDQASHDSLQAELTRLTEVLEERRAESVELKQKLAALEDLIEFKKTQMVREREQVRCPGLAEREKVIPVPDDQSDNHLRANILEVSATGYTSHPAQIVFPVLEREDPDKPPPREAADARLRRYLEEIQAKSDEEYIVFLIHPNGVDAFRSLLFYVQKHHPKIEIGWEPFSRAWVIAAQESLGSEQSD